MGDYQCLLHEEGYLKVLTESSHIESHPVLNVVFVFNSKNEVNVLDAHSGVILRTCSLSDNNGKVKGKHLPLQDKVLFWDGKNIGLRGDYSGVLLLDTILQTPVEQNDDIVRLEMLLSEAMLFQQSLQNLEETGIECPSDVSNELLEKIKEAESNTKKSIKGQRWKIVCIELPYTSLKLVANNVVLNLKRLDRHIPALAIASAINERLTDLLAGSRVFATVNPGNFQRFLMYSEAARRQTFEKWPHMDYKWALPDQMAQAGFYHQPSVTGDDRAMCFTCNVCLVCWEKTDEPWSEHERHSPNCPFVKGEYTQNVPLAVTYATNPAVATNGFNIVSNSDHSHALCTSNKDGEVTVWSLERQLKKVYSFHIKECLNGFLPVETESLSDIEITAMCCISFTSGNDQQQISSTNSNRKSSSITSTAKLIDNKILIGITVRRKIFVVVLNINDVENRIDPSSFTTAKETVDPKIMEIVEKIEDEKETSSMSSSSLKKLVADDNFDDCCQKVSGFSIKFKPIGSATGSDISLAFQDKNNANGEESETIIGPISEDHLKPPEIECVPVKYIEICPSVENEFKITELMPTLDCDQLLIKLNRIDQCELLENDECKMDVDDEDLNSGLAVHSQLLLYQLNKENAIGEIPLCSRNFGRDDRPLEVRLLPLTDNCVRKISETEDEKKFIYIIGANGGLELIALNGLRTVSSIFPKGEKLVSATYCKTLDRLIGCTDKGALVFYAWHESDSDSSDERGDDENMFLMSSDASLNGGDQDLSVTDGTSAKGSSDSKNIEECSSHSSQTFSNSGIGGDNATSSPLSSSKTVFLALKNDLSLSDLKTLYSLTLFDELLTPFTAEVPNCWNELVQAQKQRRHPQHLRPGDDTHLTKTWRLHNDATTWDEHTIEITLAEPASLGHIDLKFSLYQQCPNPPAIQVTLLRQNTSGFVHRMKTPHSINIPGGTSVDDNIEFNLSGNDVLHENPVLSEEYLNAQSAEIVAGPIELSSCLDLCDQGGLVTLTSPKLFKTRARNFILHIKTMVDPAKDGQGKTRVPVRKKGIMRLFPSFANNSSQNSTKANYCQESTLAKHLRKNDYYIGCDWLHEISITVRSVKSSQSGPIGRLQRIFMLESNIFLQKLIRIASDTSSKIKQNIAMDILIWVCTIRMARFRSPKILGRSKYKNQDNQSKTNASYNSSQQVNNLDMLAQQKECVSIFEENLTKLIEHCLINANRNLAHKTVKLILIVSEGVRNLPSDAQIRCTFDSSLVDSIIQSLPKICSANYASAIRWFTLLVCGTSTIDSHSAISEVCIKILMDVAKEISKRWNPYSSLLNSRFGLYGFPFEPDIFDIDLPLMTKSNSTPNTLANIIKSNAGLVQSGTADFKKMYSIDGVEFRSFPHLIKRKNISNQLRGLLEVEPLHFTCFAASEATRIENMDSLSSSSASNINMDEIILTPVPNLQNNIDGHSDGKKDVEKDNMNDDIMNNGKNILGDSFFSYKWKNVGGYPMKQNGTVDSLESPPSSEKAGYDYSKHVKSLGVKYIQYFDSCEEESASEEPNTGTRMNNIQQNLNENNCDENSSIFSWHKLLVSPPKQMVVIDRIHSGARRYVVIDFGSPILLTDLVIPACDELASLFIDIWCFDEETDSVRLAITQDIGSKTLVLSDLQPPPICRFMKITIIGRYGMSATRCKIPIGSFYGHVVILENDAYADPLLRHMKATPANLLGQIKALNSLYEDVHCRYSLSSSKLLELLAPILNSEMSNIAHMQAYFNKQKCDEKQIDNSKIINLYDECISLQNQLNIIRSVIRQLDASVNSNQPENYQLQPLSSASRDKLRVLSECLVEILLHFSIEFGLKNVISLHMLFNMEVANTLFNTLVVSGDAHIQLATCSLLVRMCCFQNWWGDFLANIFCTLYSSQNSKIFPQDRVFFLLTYLGRKSIAMGTCSSIVIDAILKTLAKLLAPLSPRYLASETGSGSVNHENEKSSIWAKSDLQLITWLLLFLSVCLDDNAEKKDKSANRWEFMSCEADFTKSRPQGNNSNGKTIPRCFKKRIIQQNKYNGIQSYTDWSKKFYMLQRELPEIFMEITGKPKPKVNKSNISQKPNKDTMLDSENSFDRGLKSIKLVNILVVIRGLIGLILEMDFTCSMDLFLLTCKVIARLVSACRPSVQLSKVVTTNQLEQLVRLAVWNDQQQPWAVHAITCLLQDLLDADKNFKESNNEACCSEINSMEGVMEAEEVYVECTKVEQIHSLVHNDQVIKDASYQDIKYGQLPSLIECDVEFDEFVNEVNSLDSGKHLLKKESSNHSRNSFNFFCKSVSSALDARLDYGLDTNVEIPIRRLTMISSMDLYASLPQIPTTENINTSPDVAPWPENILNTWCGAEHNSGLQSYQMFKKVFDNIFADLHLQDTWVHLEQVLQMWLSLNSELSDKPFSSGLGPSDIPKIPFGPNAVQGLLLALAWHGDIKLRTWCLGFQCLILACNSHSSLEKLPNDELYNQNIGDVIIRDENFEKMLLRFFSGFGLSTSMTSNRCAGPKICKYLHELLLWLQMKAEFAESTSNIKRKLKDTLLGVVLQLIQPGGAICNQQGPIDAQSQLVRDLISIQYDKADLNVAMSIIESVSFLVYNNISNAEKIYCQRLVDANHSNNAFGNLFATVLGAENSKQNTPVSDNSLIVSLLKLSASLVQTELYRRSDEIIDIDSNINHESQTDEIKAEQQNNNDNKVKVPCVADTVLRHFPTMKRLLGSLSHCSSSSFALLAVSSLCPLNTTDLTNSLSEPQTTVDAVFHLLILLCKKGSQPDLVVAPIFQYLETNSSPRNVLPRLQLSEPFLWYVLKVLETTSTVAIFTEMGGMKILCQNLVKCNRVLLNMQPGLISLIMQHMTKNTKLKFTTTPGSSTGSSKKSSQSSSKSPEGLINFAPFSSISSSENSTAQPADVLIQTPIASHRRARTPAWSYLFYPNESHVDLTITLPTAILLKEIQLQPHLPTLASCPSAVAVEISRDQGLGPIPFGQPLTTVGMTCIRLKLSKPEIATSIVLRLYRPKDSSSIGLTQITILGTTIFGEHARSPGNQDFPVVEDDSFAKTSVGWIRILARCFSVATFKPDKELAKKVISAAAEYPGFIEACCTLMNVMPISSSKAMQNLETVLLKLGGHSRELGLTLVHHLLWCTMPQTHRLCNEAVSDLLYDLCTMNDNYTADRISVLIDWILKLHQNFNQVDRTIGCRNPHSGFVKCIASILWTTYTRKMVLNLPNLITQDLCNACFFWMDILEDEEPLKIAFDALICSICYIKPDVFGQLLQRIGLASPNMMPHSSTADRNKHNERMTDDIKNAEHNNCEWYQHSVLHNISKLFEKPSYLHTLSMACQSTSAIYQLVSSNLPKLLACAIYEFCCTLAPEIRNLTSASSKAGNGSSMTDSDKVENCQINERQGLSAIDIKLVPDVLDFFSECCAEGYMRDWLGSYPGSVFWKPLLELLCNYRSPDSNSEPLQQYFTRVERSTINFLSRVTSCHPKNQEHLTHILISVIRMPSKSSNANKPIISGFTRRLVLQLLLESERILVSIKSKMPLQKKDHSLLLVNNHPSKRTNAHHLLFYLSSYTKCQDILQNCVSVYILPTINSERQNESTGQNISLNNQNDNRKDILDMSFSFNGHGMELLSVVAGVTAKDKRIKDVKNQAAAFKDLRPIFPKILNDENLASQNAANIASNFQLEHPDCPDVLLSGETTISQILAILSSRGNSLSTPCITLNLVPPKNPNEELSDEFLIKAGEIEPLPTPLQRFSSCGGLSLLAHYLPTVYPESTKAIQVQSEKEKSPQVNEWIKVGPNEEIYDDMEEVIVETNSKVPIITSVPQHSLAAFGLFLRLPAYSDVLLRDKLKAQCLLRLVLGVTGDGEGNDIYSLSVAPTLPTLPFEVFRKLLNQSPLTTDDGVLLRRKVIEVGAMHLVLNCLSIFTHQSQNYPIATGPQTEMSNGVKNSNATEEQVVSDDKSHVYWAKGTGFGTGSTQQSWNVEQALLRKKSEEEHVTVLLQVLSSYINPGDKIPQNRGQDEPMCYGDMNDTSDELPSVFLELLQQSCLIPALSSYLRNDSVLDITRHIPLYRSILQLLRAIALSTQLVSLLQPQLGSEGTMSIAALLTNMKTCVDTYAKRLKVNKKSNIKGQTQKVTINLDDGEDEGLALLIPDIQETASLVQKSANIDSQMNHSREMEILNLERPLSTSIEQRYLEVMKKLQFDTYEMIAECENGYKFVVSHHFENNVRMAGDRGHPSRMKRLAQETVTLSTSLPLSYSSSVFVRCDTDRLDIMKMLITGPSETPYANGCFEFDVYFPPDYPNSPMLINLETTGRHTVRFNPNLYNDGKVCLSVLNTWHGRPEEKWNAQTSSFLQVLVSIQSLILVPEPYFNEPGFERSRGTPSGTHSSREYNSNIYQACVRWAMLEQIRNPSPCFKEVIHTHFWLKRHEICAQIESWIEELSKTQYSERNGRTISFNSMVLRRQYRQLREELAKLSVPEGLEDLDQPFNPNVTTISAMTEAGPAPMQMSTQDSSPTASNSEMDENPIEAAQSVFDSPITITTGNSENEEDQTNIATDSWTHIS